MKSLEKKKSLQCLSREETGSIDSSSGFAFCAEVELRLAYGKRSAKSLIFTTARTSDIYSWADGREGKSRACLRCDSFHRCYVQSPAEDCMLEGELRSESASHVGEVRYAMYRR